MASRSALLALVATSAVSGCLGTNTLPARVEIGNGNLGPLAADKAGLVQSTAIAASQLVLAHERETGWPDENIVWEDGGCVLVAWYEMYPMSRAPNPPPPYPVYLVGLKSGQARAWVMVDARTGELGAYIGDQPEFPCETIIPR
jgi:hypothetical protein